MPAPPALDLIHGFTQDAGAWRAVIGALPADWSVNAIELPGHGSQSDRCPADAEEMLELVSSSLEPAPESRPRILCGYSMGARIALQLAAADPARWTHVVAISSGPGLDSQSDRMSRFESDAKIAALLRTGTIRGFADYWDSLAIWAGDPDSVRSLRRAMILGQEPKGLAAALIAAGQGALTPFAGWPSEAGPRLLALRGSRDAAYELPTEELARRAGGSVSVIDGGHSLPLENPAAIAAELVSFAA